jgi:hypothetical protein
VLDLPLVSAVLQASGKARGKAEALVYLSQQKRARVTGQCPAVISHHNGFLEKGEKRKLRRTLCH